MQAEHGQAGKVDRAGKQAEVGGDLAATTDPGAAAAVAAADQMGELAFDLGPGRAVVGGPGRVGVAGTGGGQLRLVVADPDRAASGGAGAPWASGQAAQAAPNRAVPPPARQVIATVTWLGQVTVPPARSMANRSLAKRPPGAVGGGP